MNKLLLLFVFMLGFSANAQTKILRFSEAENQGVSSHELDKIYKSAVHTDPKLAVFKTDGEQQRLQKAYVQFFSDFGKYLNDNQFKWESKTRCFNRIYMQKDGTVDYFLFDFGKTPLPETTENRFRQLLSEFLKTNKFPITASEKFAQCSPITYQ